MYEPLLLEADHLPFNSGLFLPSSSLPSFPASFIPYHCLSTPHTVREAGLVPAGGADDGVGGEHQVDTVQYSPAVRKAGVGAESDALSGVGGAVLEGRRASMSSRWTAFK